MLPLCELHPDEVIGRSWKFPDRFDGERKDLLIFTSILLAPSKVDNEKSCLRLTHAGLNKAKNLVLATNQRNNYNGFAAFVASKLTQSWKENLHRLKEKSQGNDYSGLEMTIVITPLDKNFNVVDCNESLLEDSFEGNPFHCDIIFSKECYTDAGNPKSVITKVCKNIIRENPRVINFIPDGNWNVTDKIDDWDQLNQEILETAEWSGESLDNIHAICSLIEHN